MKGSGTLNIVDWCAENGNPSPTWREEAGSVCVTFAPATPGGGTEATGEVGGEVKGEVVAEVAKRPTRQVPDKLPGKKPISCKPP